jgi:hypothetical protein
MVTPFDVKKIKMNQSLNVLQFYKLVRNVIIRFPILEGGGRIDTFAYKKDKGDVEHSTFGCNYRDFQLGLYWDREWAKNEFDKNEMNGSNNALFLEWKTSSFSSLNVGDHKCKIWFNSMLNMEQDGVMMSREEGQYKVKRNLLMVLKELQSVGLYTVVDGMEEIDLWLSKSEADVKGEEVDDVSFVGTDIMGRIMNKRFDIKASKWGLESVVSCFCEIDVLLCVDDFVFDGKPGNYNHSYIVESC